jgi:LysM repeat protein
MQPRPRRTLTPAVALSALFTAACAVLAIGFVATRGGLVLPVAATNPPPVAATSPSPPPSAPGAPSLVPATASPAVPTPSIAPVGSPPTVSPAISSPTPTAPADPLTALPLCPDHPGCHEYRIRRGDSLSGVADRYAVSVHTVLALNPEVTDPGTIVVGQVLYLGRDPTARLDDCPDRPSCALYIVQPGDRLSTIAGRYETTLDAVLALNPEISDPGSIRSGQVVRLPRSSGA